MIKARFRSHTRRAEGASFRVLFRSAAAMVSMVLAFAACPSPRESKPVPDAPRVASREPEPPPRVEAKAEQQPHKLFAAPAARGGGSFAAIASQRVRSQLRIQPKRSEQIAAPIALTASDGTGLALVRLAARAAIEGPLALSELHLVFKNPEPRVIEGRFTIALPPGAAISRFAMKLPQGWQEAEVVERRAAQEAYEDFLHRRQDPALLEKKAGNEFSARIFPIPPSGEKEIKITYSQELTSAAGVYRLPLRGLPAVGQIEATLIHSARDAAGICLPAGSLGARSKRAVSFAAKAVKPAADFVVHTAGGCVATGGPEARPSLGLRHGNLALARVRPQLAVTEAPLEKLLFLVDTSASRATGFAAQLDLLEKLIARLPPRSELEVACFDQGVESVYQGAAGKFDARSKILERGALGASNLHAALLWAATRVGMKRIVILGDGVATAGITDGGELTRAAKALKPIFDRIDAVLVGGIRDEALMRRLARGTLAKDGVVLDGEGPVETVARRLGQTTVSGVEVDVKGARWVWPSRLDGIQPGDEVLVYADLPPAALAEGQPLVVGLSGALTQSHRVALSQTERPLLERAWVAAQIARLEDERDRAPDADPVRKERIKAEILALSIKHRVLSDTTALLVLETEADYARFRIDRKALTQILAVGPEGVSVLQRKDLVFADAQPAGDRDADGEDARGPRRVRVRDPEGRKQALKQAVAKVGLLKALEGRGGGSAASVLGESDGFRGVGGVGSGGRGAPRLARGPGGQGSPRSGAKSERRAAHDEKAAPRAEPTPAPIQAARARARVARARAAVDGVLGRQTRVSRDQDESGDGTGESSTPALTGKLATITALIKARRIDDALLAALRWRSEDAGDVLALVALGNALKAGGQLALAARAYGSIIDLFPSRADMRRYAGMLLESLGSEGLGLAADSFAESVLQRPDHPNSHRLLAYALLRQGELPAAFTAIEAGVKREYPENRFAGVDRILREDLALCGEAWIARDPQQEQAVKARLLALRVNRDQRPSLRFVLSWETDANDVDFHIRDAQGGHAFYSRRTLPSGGALYADVTTGYGPECFTIEGKPQAFPYRLQIHYYSRGPMGYGMGKLEIVQHDGKGGLRFEQRPYVVMNDRAYVDLGVVKAPL